jgi:hypothetical protein
MNKWFIQINSLDIIRLHYIYLDCRSRKCVICQLPLRWIEKIDISCFISFRLDPILTGAHSLSVGLPICCNVVYHR